MPSLLSSQNISGATGSMINHFDTFSQGRSVVIYRESLRTEVSTSEVIFGYGEQQPGAEYNFLEVKQEFPAVVRYIKLKQKNHLDPDMEVRYPESEVIVKVREDAHQYIQAERVTKISVDGLFWTIIGGPKKKLWMGVLPFYYYELKRMA